MGAVVIEGPRACGKTSTARRFTASEALLDTDENARRMVGADPSLALAGAIPRLFDEWQVAPSIWNHVRRAVDDRGASGQFILTGSAVPADDITRHTGAGRFSRLRMRPMSLFELGISSGYTSLAGLLDGDTPRAKPSPLTLLSVAEALCVGGWPGNLGTPTGRQLRANRDYLEEIPRVDLSRVDRKARDPVRVGRLLRSLARNVATPVSVSRLAAGRAEPVNGRPVRQPIIPEDLRQGQIGESPPALATRKHQPAPIVQFLSPPQLLRCPVDLFSLLWGALPRTGLSPPISPCRPPERFAARPRGRVGHFATRGSDSPRVGQQAGVIPCTIGTES